MKSRKAIVFYVCKVTIFCYYFSGSVDVYLIITFTYYYIFSQIQIYNNQIQIYNKLN